MKKITTSKTKRGKCLPHDIPHDTLDLNIFSPQHDIMVVKLSEYVWGLNL